MEYQTVSVRKERAAFIIQMHRPSRRNAISEQMMDDIITACSTVANDNDVAAIILTGGAEYFSAGADLNEAFKVQTAQEGRSYFSHWHHLNTALEESPKPVLAAIEGFCMQNGRALCRDQWC